MTSSTSSSEAPDDGARFRFPWAFLVALLVGLGIEAALALVVPGRTKYPREPYQRFYPPDRVPTFEESITQWQIHQGLNVIGAQDIILLGDSSCLMGLRPNQIMRETGLSVWNLGTLGFYGVDGHTRLLEAHIRRFAPPRVVVYHVSYWTLKYTKQPQWYQRYLDWLKRVEGKTNGSNAGRIRTWLPSLAYREVSRNWLVPESVKVGFLDERRSGHISDNGTRKELLEKRGALEEPGVGVWPKAPEVPFGVSEESARALERLFQLAKHHGFGVLVVMQPLPKIAATPKNLAGIEQLQTDLEKLASSHGHVCIADPIVTFLPNNVCQSITHVLEKGAQQNSARILRRLVLPGRARYPKVPYRRFYAPGRVPSFEESITQWQVHQALNVAGPQDIILLGDSSCLMGFRPNRIMRETGLSVWNLGTLGVYGVDGHTRLLEAHIRRFAPPRLVIYNVSYWPLKATKRADWHQRFLDFLERVESNANSRNVERIPALLPNLAYREASRNWLVPESVKVSFLDEPRGGHTSDNDTRKELIEKRGALEEPGVGVWPKVPEVPFGVSEESARALERLFQLAKHHGFGVLVVMEPLPKIAATPKNLAGIEQTQTELEKLARSHRHVRIADPIVSFLPNDVCQSITHVLEKGAQQNSAKIIEHIRRCEDLMRPLSPKH